jgi:hypothetical protein
MYNRQRARKNAVLTIQKTYRARALIGRTESLEETKKEKKEVSEIDERFYQEEKVKESHKKRMVFESVPIAYMVEPNRDNIFAKKWNNQTELTEARKRFFMAGTIVPSIRAFSSILIYFGSRKELRKLLLCLCKGGAHFYESKVE